MVDRPQQAALQVSMARVRAARRVDWRYLLPQADFRRIAVVVQAHAEPDHDLVSALRHEGTDVRTITMTGLRPAETHDRDLIVLSAADASTIRCAAAAADVGCVLYAELRHRPRTRFRSTRAIHTTLRRIGFEPLAVHWHRPSHEHCEQAVPLGSPQALITALRRRKRGRVGALRLAVGIFLVRLRLFDRVAWPLSVTARWTGPS